MTKDISWADLERAEARIHIARGYSSTYRRLLFHSARRVLEANGLAGAEFDPGLRIPIDPESVDLQVARFAARATGSASKPSTTRNYADNWQRFARWVRDYLDAEAQGREELYLAPLAKRRREAEDRRREERATEVADEFFSVRPLEMRTMSAPRMALSEEALPMEALALASASPPDSAGPASRSRPQRLVVRTSFGPLEMELPGELSAEDAVRIAAAVLRLAQ